MVVRYLILNWGGFAPQGTLGSIWRHFLVASLGERGQAVTGISWEEAGDYA